MAGTTKIADHVNTEKPLVQQEKTDFYAPPADNRQQALDYLFHRFAVLHMRQRQGIPVPLVQNHGRSVSMKVRCPRFGLAAKNLLGIPSRPPVVRNERQVDPQHPRLASHGLGHAGHQGRVQATLQLAHFGQCGRQGVANGLIGRRVCQTAAGGKQGNHPRRRNQQNIQQHRSRTFVTLILQAKCRAQPIFGIGMNFGFCNDILRL